MTRAIPDVLLERYRLRELPAPQQAAIEREAVDNPDVRARLDVLDRSDAEIRDRYSPRTLAGRPAPRRRPIRALALAGALTAAVGSLIVAVPRLTVPGDETRIKGAAGRPGLVVYRRTAAGSERLADGDVGRAGDLLRIGYASAGRGYGMILSIDGAGAVTLHLPPSGEVAAALEPGGINLLDSAYELDDAPRVERFYLVTGRRPFAVAPLLDVARHAGGAPVALPLSSELEQVTFSIQKEVRK